jgi:hypothetical protein
MRLNKLAYLLTPPALYRLYTKLTKKNSRTVDGNSAPLANDKNFLKEFRKKRMSFFFDDKMIDEFCDYMESHFFTNAPIPAKNKTSQPYLDQLINNGYCKIEGLFSKEQITQWHDIVYPEISGEISEFHALKKEHGIASGKDINLTRGDVRYCHDLRSGIIRAWSIASLDPSINTAFRDNKTINDIVNSYLSGKSNESTVYADFKGIPLCKDGNLNLHADDIFKQVKVFLPLNNITTENAPFVYYGKSHRPHEWRLLRDFIAFTRLNIKLHATNTSWNDYEMCRLAEDYPEITDHEDIVTANAGDVIIADTRGIHGGSLLHSGYRLQLGTSYSMLGNFHCSLLPEHLLSMARNT